MYSKNIGYHTRRQSDGQKMVGGSFGGSLDMDTANRLVNAHFSVAVKPSGRAVFVDREGREVSLYMSVDPDQTTKGIATLAAWRAEQAQKESQRAEQSQREQEQIADLMQNLSHDEIIRRLTE